MWKGRELKYFLEKCNLSSHPFKKSKEQEDLASYMALL